MSDKVKFRAGIALQPHALESSRPIVEAALDDVDLTPFREGTIALVGIGASLYAATSGAAQLRVQGRRAFAMAGTDLYDPSIDAADCYVAISASGRSVEPAMAMGLRPGVTRLGFAKAAGTPLEHSVTTLIGTGSGVDSGPNTTSYVASLQAVGLLAERIGLSSGFDWSSLPEELASISARIGASVDRASALLEGKTFLDCVGAGVAYGTAGYGALLIREAVRVAAQNWDTLNYLHGPMEPNDHRSGVILFGDGREVKLAGDLAAFGIASVLFTTRADLEDRPNLAVVPVPSLGHGLADAIVHSVPLQLIVAGLAEAAGLPECIFRYRQTDTKLALE